MANLMHSWVKNPVSVNVPRSVQTLKTDYKTTFSLGQLIPFYVNCDVLPGSTFSINVSDVIRTSTFLRPIMDNLYADIYFFFVPHRLALGNDFWERVLGSDNPDAWSESTTETDIPGCYLMDDSQASHFTGSIYDYLGLPKNCVVKDGDPVPTSIDDSRVFSTIPINAYIKVWNDWFRDQNTMIKQGFMVPSDPLHAAHLNMRGGLDNPWYCCRGGVLPVSKFHDLFTSALPAPQKGAAVSFGMAGQAPLVGLSLTNTTVNPPVQFFTDGDNVNGTRVNLRRVNQASGDPYVYALPTSSTVGTLVGGIGQNTVSQLNTDGAYADLAAASGITINQLRQSFAAQAWLEKLARGGSRYTEMLRSQFGVVSPDARLQRAEYLGGKRIPLNINQVIQSSATADEPSPLADTAGYSLTGDSSSMFTKTFTEHGTVLGLVCVRQNHTYQQGMDKQFRKFSKLDFYWPAFANIGEQPIKNSELYLSGNSTVDNQTFGFQEAWYEYRNQPSKVTGYFRSDSGATLDSWHLADDYSTKPVLNADFISETPNYLDRALVYNHTVQPQFIADFYTVNTAALPIPTYSIPSTL